MGTGDAGFVVKDSDGNQLINNTAHDNSDSGIALDTANDNIVRGNDVRFNPGGLDLEDSSRNLIEANDASLTTGIGIELGPASLENRVVLNKASGNGAHGIYVGEEAPEGLGSLIEHNTASGNAGDGIHVAKGGHTISANVAHDNAGWGIYAAGGSIDGGANIGRGNGEPGQCFNVVCAVDTTIDSGPDNPTTSTSATFTFSANDPGATFECALDDASFAACASPVELSGLAVGAHTFEVRAIDMVGNIDPTPASYTWTVRLMPFSMFLPVVVN
jgi:parallel beta-helix repeat protein